ncbi:RmlC-like cupin domain-containing protein [Elsinoe ampelina]|uniref:RmlC-like cupin domain-containing protein n=1 Tax=Elsinoe ampelina TaxID=302913 RepID=A0A6A6GET9_9PEZI|nr:RmlC-like cupin domain-containing protein [Elsinoe ampelina]
MSHISFKALCVASLLVLADCAPARRTPSRGTVRRQADQGSDAPAGPPGASGQLRGPVSLGVYSSSNPVSSSDTAIPSDQYELAPGQQADEDLGFYLDLSNIDDPQPICGIPGNTPTDSGPRNRPLDRESSDFFAPPRTDAGSNVDVLLVPTALAGVNMRLEANSYQELHRQQASEWAYILNSTVRLTSVNGLGQTFTDDLQAGDVWFFPAGIPHSVQAFAEGVTFLLVFDNGAFSEDETFLLMMRNPRSVLAKDIRVNISASDQIPEDELYIFRGTPPPSNITEQNPHEVPSGSVKVLDTVSFLIAKNFGRCTLHWHFPNSDSGDEWNFFIQGQARATVFSAPSSSRTFDFQAGDVGYVPTPDAHYLENTGIVDLVYLEILQAPVFNDVSVAQWLGLTPKQTVKDHLGFSEETLNRLPMVKPYILPGSTDKTETDFRQENL